jgi:hypothetical protein
MSGLHLFEEPHVAAMNLFGSTDPRRTSPPPLMLNPADYFIKNYTLLLSGLRLTGQGSKVMRIPPSILRYVSNG